MLTLEQKAKSVAPAVLDKLKERAKEKITLEQAIAEDQERRDMMRESWETDPYYCITPLASERDRLARKDALKTALNGKLNGKH